MSFPSHAESQWQRGWLYPYLLHPAAALRRVLVPPHINRVLKLPSTPLVLNALVLLQVEAPRLALIKPNVQGHAGSLGERRQLDPSRPSARLAPLPRHG